MAIRGLSLLLAAMLLTGCQSGNWLIGTNPFDLSEEEVEALLAEVVVLYVPLLHLEGSCPQGAVQVAMEGGVVADCILFNVQIQAYIRKDLSPDQTYHARRHVASHIYDIAVRGASRQETAAHVGW